MPARHFDAVIVGGGAAGSATALTMLQQGGRTVAIVEPSDFSEPRVGETIPPDANMLLEELGVTRAFRAGGHLACYGSASLWGNERLGHNDFAVNVHGHGWHLDRARFDAMLLQQATAAGARIFPESCRAVQVDQDRVTGVSLGSVDLSAGAYIDATGRSGLLVKALGIARDDSDRQVVIWARFRLDDLAGFGNSTWLESAPYGWWYGARLPGDQAIVALGTDPHVAKSTNVYDMKHWLFQLAGTRLMAPRLSGARLIPDSFRVTASHSYCIRRAAGSNWIAVGDAASAFDPLSSAGIHKAMLTGQRAAQAISVGQRQSYCNGVRNDYRAYLGLRAQLYQAEQRWPHHRFWRERIAVPETA